MNIEQLLLEPRILSSLIQATATIFGSLVALVGLLITTNAIWNRRKLKTSLLEAYQDLRVYQEVERVHVEMNIGRGETSNMNKVRNIVFEEKGIRTSGKNSPAQVERKIARLEGSE